MAIKYYPEDIDNQVIGLKFPINGSTVGSTDGFFNVSRTTEDQAVTNYINLLLTRKGERYMLPDYGIGLQLSLFEPNTISLRDRIEFDIRTQTAYWLPYINNLDIQVLEKSNLLGTATDPETGIQVIITFSVSNSDANKTIILFQENGRISTILQ